MKGFTNITIKKKTVERFREFSKKHFNTHTEALAGMLDFFFYNEISPKENFGPTGRRIENSLKKRINAVIAIMKDVEKNKVIPLWQFWNHLWKLQIQKIKTHIRKKGIMRKMTLILIFINNSLCI
jgi:hypothetical protein